MWTLKLKEEGCVLKVSLCKKELRSLLMALRDEHPDRLSSGIGPCTVLDALSRIDAAKAEATRESDKRMIFSMIEQQVDRGLEGLNATVKAELRERLVEVAEDAAMEAGESVAGAKLLYGVGCVLFDMQLFGRALPLLKRALALQKKHFGADGIETAITVYKIGEASSRISNHMGMPWYERSLKISRKHYGVAHVSTALTLIGIGRVHGTGGDQAKRIDFCRRAIKLIQAAKCATGHVDTHVEALSQIGTAHFINEEWTDCLECCSLSIRLHEAKHGRGRTTTASSLCIMAAVYGKLGLHEKEMELHHRVLRIQVAARGPLSREAGLTGGNLGTVHYNKGQYAESATYLRKAVDAMVFTYGPDSPDTEKYLTRLEMAVSSMDDGHTQTEEHRHYLGDVRRQAKEAKEAKDGERAARKSSEEIARVHSAGRPVARVHSQEDARAVAARSRRGGMRGRGLRMMPALGRRVPGR
jgi:tetratricopeptide (TPR) repeat protein